MLMPVLTDRDHPQQIVHIKHSERALKEIACLTKTDIENPDQKISWWTFSYDEGLASRVQYESAASPLIQSKRSFTAFMVRHGLAINMEHNFMTSY